MTNDALSVLVCIFNTIWRLFNSWYIPGTNVTPAVAMFGIVFCVIMFNFISSALGIWENNTKSSLRESSNKVKMKKGD